MDTFYKQDEEALEPEVESSQLIAAETLDRFATSGWMYRQYERNDPKKEVSVAFPESTSRWYLVAALCRTVDELRVVEL